MATWQIDLHNVGTERITTTTVVSVPDLVRAKQEAARECRRYLSGGGSLYLEARGNYTYALVLGLDEVGEVRITRTGVHSHSVP